MTTVADQFAETLAAAGVKRIYGVVGDSLNGFTDALRLCFASTPPDRIHEGLARLRRAVDQLAKG